MIYILFNVIEKVTPILTTQKFIRYNRGGGNPICPFPSQFFPECAWALMGIDGQNRKKSHLGNFPVT